MKRATVIGWPIEHSKSPLIHGYWLDKHGIEGSYDKTAVRPEDLADFIRRSWEEGLAGFNATIPHKVMLMDMIEPDETAKAIGAINTVYRGDQCFIGTNTDGLGWWHSLGQASAPKHALVLGAGGAAKAVVHTLRTLGSEVTVSNRTHAKAEALGEAVIDWPGAEIDGRGYDLIVNTSACGMKGENPLILIHLDPGTLVSDLVYVPLETQLLASTKALGGAPIDGLGMLLHQAAGGFEKWFGVRPEVTEELRQHVLSS